MNVNVTLASPEMEQYVLILTNVQQEFIHALLHQLALVLILLEATNAFVNVVILEMDKPVLILTSAWRILVIVMVFVRTNQEALNASATQDIQEMASPASILMNVCPILVTTTASVRTTKEALNARAT